MSNVPFTWLRFDRHRLMLWLHSWLTMTDIQWWWSSTKLSVGSATTSLKRPKLLLWSSCKIRSAHLQVSVRRMDLNFKVPLLVPVRGSIPIGIFIMTFILAVRVLLGYFWDITVSILGKAISLSQLFQNLSIKVVIGWSTIDLTRSTLIFAIVDHILIRNVIYYLVVIWYIILIDLITISDNIASNLLELTLNCLYL